LQWRTFDSKNQSSNILNCATNYAQPISSNKIQNVASTPHMKECTIEVVLDMRSEIMSLTTTSFAAALSKVKDNILMGTWVPDLLSGER
jgi:hypothetical protein